MREALIRAKLEVRILVGNRMLVSPFAVASLPLAGDASSHDGVAVVPIVD